MEIQTTILIVDDEAPGREALEGVLFSQGYKLIFAHNGQEAIQIAQESMPDLILLDVMMPKMDGFEVCSLMRADPVLAEIPILLVTALDDRISRIKGIEAGADDFISKPFDRIELRARVRTVVRLNRYRRLLLERARFVWVTEQSREGYIILDSNQMIKYANPAARLHLNLPESDITVSFRAWVEKYYHCEPEEGWSLWEHCETLETPLFLIRPETAFPRPVWLQLEQLTLPSGDGNNTLVRICEVTEKLALYQEISNFHQMITHKLRTPLSNIVMAVELFNRQMADKTSEDIQGLFGMITTGAIRLKSEVEEILRYINMVNNTKTGAHFPLSEFPEMIRRVCSEIGVGLAEIKIDPTFSKNAALQLSNHAIEVIFWEILENSKKFHPNADPSLEVQIFPSRTDSALISIRDNGKNLLPEQLRRVWAPYYQVEKEFTGEVEGMGLGLSTVAKLIWEVGGKCRAANREDGPGIVVDLIIPLKFELFPFKITTQDEILRG